MTAKKLSLSIGIPAFNEEANIQKLLRSVLLQKQTNFKLKEIVVISDGSTDKTGRGVKKIRSKRIKLINSAKRIGQNLQMNKLLKILKADILVFLEADTVLNSKLYLANLINPFYKDRKLSLVYGSTRPLKCRKGTLTQKSLGFIDSLKEKMFETLKKGDNIYVCGSGKAFSKSFAKKFRWKADVPEDSFVYLFCKQKGLKILHQSLAVAGYRSPANIEDYLRKSTKFNKGIISLKKYFPAEFVSHEYKLPGLWLIIFLWRGFKSEPVLMLNYLKFLLISRIYMLFAPPYSPLWRISSSTKRLDKNR